MNAARSSYPLQIDGEVGGQLSRWLWLVKWVLAIPHFVVLVFLWIGFVLATVVRPRGAPTPPLRSTPSPVGSGGTMPSPSPPSVAGQSVEALGGRWSIIVRQRREHERLRELVGRVRATAGAEQDEALTQLCRLVFPHAFAEEAVLFPAARKVLAEGDRLTLEVEQEHQEINEVYAAVERSRRGDPGREALIERAIALLDEDVREEEDELLPRLRAALDDAELQRLGRAWELVRRISPTRAHPVVSRRPPGQTLSALPLTILDRGRDLLDRLARSAPGPVATGSVVASQALGTVAGLVERLPPLPRGEHPSTHTTRDEVER